MKKLKVCLLALCCLVVGVSLTACGQPKINFNEEQITLSVGQEIDPAEFVTLEGVSLEDVTFTSGDSNILYIKPNSMWAGRSAGTCIVYAQAGSTFTQVSVRVEGESVKLSTPLGLTYSDGKLSWQEVIESVNGQTYVCDNYELTLTQGEDVTVISNIVTNSYSMQSAGTFTATVRAVGGANFIPSEQSEEYTFSAVFGVEDVNYDKETSKLSWEDTKNTANTTYRVVKNGVYLDNIITKGEQNSFEVALPLSGGESLSIQVVAMVDKFSAKSELLKFSMLDAVEIKVENGEITWDRVIGAESYEVFVENVSTGTSTSEVVTETSYSIQGKSAGEYRIYVKAKSSENSTFESQTSNILNVTKLPVANLAFNYDTNMFTVTNSQTYAPVISIKNARTGAEEIVENSSYTFSKLDSDTYSVSAYFKAQTNTEINGDTGEGYEITQLGSATLSHTYANGVSEVSFDSILNAQNFVVYKKLGEANFVELGSYEATGEGVETLNLGSGLFDEVGVYTLKVEAKNSGLERSIYLTSEMTIDIERLPLISNVTVLDNTISWDSVPNATGYEYYFEVYGSDKAVTSVMTTTANSIELPSLGYGEYTFKVRALGNNSNILDALNYSASEKITITESLLAPTLVFDRESKTLTLTPQDSFQNTTYQLKFYSTDGTLQFTESVLEDGKIEKSVAEYLNLAGVYRVTAQAVNSNPLINDSNIYEIHIQKLIAPSKIKVQGGVVSTADTSFNGNTAVLGSDPTIIKINGVEDIVLSSEQSDFTIEVAYRSEEYRIENGIRTYYLDSDFQTFKVERLDTPVNLRYDFIEQQLVWDEVSNVDNYNVYINNLIVNEPLENYYAYESTEAFTAKVSAVKEDITSLGAISAGEVGYITSYVSSELQVKKADNLTGLKLDIGDSLTLSWNAVTNVSEINYKVLVDGEQVGETNENTFVLTSDFSQAKVYTIEVLASGNTFLDGESMAITLEKLVVPSELVKEAGKDIYHLELIAGAVSFSVNGEVSQNISLESLTAEEGEAIKRVKFNAISSSEVQDGRYYLSSEESEFTFSRLNAPTNLSYSAGTLSWNEVENSKYVIEITNAQGTTSYQADTNSLQVSEVDNFSFRVMAESVNDINSIQANQTVNLNSVYSESFEVVKENAVQNLKLEVEGGKVKISFTWQSKLSNTPNFEIYLDSVLEASQPTLEEGVYTYTFSQTFEEVKTYVISVLVSGDVFIDSDSQTIYAERLKAPESARVQNGVFEAINNVSANIKGIAYNGEILNSLDLNTLAENTDLEILVKFVAIDTQEITNGYYYLDSAETTFKAYKLFTPSTPSVADGMISWNENTLADSYTLKLTNSDNVSYLIENLTQTSISVQDSRLLSFVSEIGDYSVQVRYIVSDVTNLSPYIQTENAPVANVSSDYSPVFTLTKLDTVKNLAISVDEADPEQKEVTLSWDAVSGASTYTVFINNVIVSEIDVTNITYTDELLASGNYTVSVRANGDDKISSETESVSFTRLAPVTSGSIDYNAYATWSRLDANPYHIVMFVDSTGEVFYQGDTENNYMDFAENSGLNGYAGGIVNFKVLVKGDGSATLSSPYFNFDAVKLTAPNVNMYASYMTIEEQGIAPEDSYNFQTTITPTANPGLNFIVKDNQHLTYAVYYYIDMLPAGELKFTTKAVSNMVNVLSSNEVVITKTRLNTITNHIFKRESLSQEELALYTSDSTTTYRSDKVYIEFTPAENAVNYNLSVVNSSYTASLGLDSSRIDITGGLDDALRGNFSIRVVSMANDDSEFINSAPYTITGTRLNGIASNTFITRDGKVSWTDSQTGVTNYLIKVSEIDGADWGYWQSADGGTRLANLNGLDSGVKAYNIKALGNITESGISSGVVLDSKYLTDAKQFTKLERPTATVYNGYLATPKIENATTYYAIVDGVSYLLSDYSYISQNDEDYANYFVGYNDSMAINLEAEKTYQVQIQARGSTTDIYSDYSDVINIRFLPNANTSTSDVKLELDPSGDLTKTRLTFNLADNHNGVVVAFQKLDGMYILSGVVNYNAVTTNGGKYYIARDKIHEYMENATIRISSKGSSTLQSGNFYYLNSAYSQSFTLNKLAEPENLRIEDGIIKWDAVPSASGYYVYINRNQYYVGNEYDMYTQTSLALPEIYGSATENTVYSIGVVAVSATTDYISSHWFNNETDLEGGYYKEDIVLPHAPDTIDLIDGSLVWSDGLSGLDGVDTSNILSLGLNINNILNAPILILYNAGSLTDMNLQFEIPSIELRFTDVVTNKVYDVKLESNMTQNEDGTITLDLEYLDFIKVSSEQIQKIKDLKQAILDSSALTGITADSQIIKVIDALVLLLEERLEEINGWPNIYTLFEELKSANSIPAGRYYIQMRQVGVETFLNSNFTSRREVYIPEAPYNATIEAPETQDGEKQFYLTWDNVTINSNITYSAEYKYLIIAENSLGERRIIARVNETAETSAGNNRTRLNLTTLVNDGTLTSDDVKLFVVVAGDSDSTLIGLKSTELSIQVLPEVTPFMDEGYLSWNTLASTYGVQIIAVNEAHVINETIALSQTMRRWSGDTMTAGAVYSVSIRAVGEVYISEENGTKTFVISGKKTEFSLHKLSAPNVAVNTNGEFSWSAVTGNVSGYLVNINGEELSLTPNTLKYESTFVGYNLYEFRSQGDTATITSGNTYYINSLPNKQEGKDYSGIYGVMLPEIDEITIEEGNLKWQTVNLSAYNLNAIADQENYKQTVVYKLTIGDNVYYIDQESYQDVNGAYVTFGEFDELPAGTYNITLQAFLYWKPRVSTGSLPDLIASFTNNVNNRSDYFALLGEKSTTLSGDITKAKSITADVHVNSGLAIEDGMLVWDFVTEDQTNFKHLDYILTFATDENFTQNVITVNATFDGTSLYAKWWDEVLLDGLDYYVKVRVNGKDSYLSSSANVYADSASSPVVLRKVGTLRFKDMLMNEGVYPYGDENYGNYIRIELNSSALQTLSSTYNYGFELRYRAIGSTDDTPWNTYNFGELDFEMGGENTVIYTLDISELGQITSFEYQVQLVLLDDSNVRWLKSNWSDKDNFNTPSPIDAVLLDEERQEFYWKDELIPESSTYYGYIVLDELLDADGSVLKSYKFIIPSGSHAGQDYSALISGERYVYYAPFENGTHRISVRKTPDNQGALVSSETYYKVGDEAYTTFNFNLFETNPLNSGDNGSSANPYLIQNQTDFLNISLRTTKYSYMTSYVNQNGETVSAEPAYSFVQTTDIEIRDTISGYLFANFKNIYDGDGFKLTYTISNSGSNASLINIIGESGIIRNVRLDVTLNPTNSTITFASLALTNNGRVSNSVLESVSIASNSASINYAGFVYTNYGRLERLISIAEFTASNVANAGAIAYENARTSATIYQSGNNGNITLTGTNLAQKIAGIVVSNSGTVDECYNKGTLSINSNVSEVQLGGIVAQNAVNSTIINTYNTGYITLEGSHSNVSLGGIVGYSSNNNITNSYNIVVITSPAGGVSSSFSYGAIIGRLSSSLSERNNFYAQASTSAIGNTSSTNFAKGYAIAVMQGAEFVQELNAGDTAFVQDTEAINGGYPIFAFENSEDLLYNNLG